MFPPHTNLHSRWCRRSAITWKLGSRHTADHSVHAPPAWDITPGQGQQGLTLWQRCFHSLTLDLLHPESLLADLCPQPESLEEEWQGGDLWHDTLLVSLCTHAQSSCWLYLEEGSASLESHSFLKHREHYSLEFSELQLCILTLSRLNKLRFYTLPRCTLVLLLPNLPFSHAFISSLKSLLFHSAKC